MWRSINTFYLNDEWQYSNPIQGEIFRVKSFYIENFNNQYLKGAIASIFVDDQQVVNLVESRRLSYRPEPEIFTFYFPPGLGNQRIGVKRLDATDLNWTIEVEVFTSNSQDNFVNYILSRFGELMPIFDTANGSTSIGTRKEKIEANVIPQPYKLEVDNLTSIQETRRGLTIYNASPTATVTIGCAASEDENGVQQLDGVLAIIAPSKVYELPVSGDGSCYSGVIYGKSDVVDNNNSLQITEFVAIL